MGQIHKLPDHIINRLKAGEVIDRPASIVKELIENSLDAGATSIDLYVLDGGKKRIMINDNGSGMPLEDLTMTIERYATSKITADQDLMQIESYGFRGEALASIAEVSQLTIQSKTAESPIGHQLSKNGTAITTKKIATGFDHGTTVVIEDLFYNIPARRKFLKSNQTEYYYIYQLFINYALIHRDKDRALTKQGKQIFQLHAASDLAERIQALFKKDRADHMRVVDFDDGVHRIYGLVGDPVLRFGSQEHIKLFVNQRPVQDKVIKRALFDAYRRQLPQGQYPFAVLFVQIDPQRVDVNVHPRKMEVKFLDPGSVFQLIKSQIELAIGADQMVTGDHRRADMASSVGHTAGYTSGGSSSYSAPYTASRTAEPSGGQPLFGSSDFPAQVVQRHFHQESAETIGEYELVGQLWDSYIVLQDQEHLYYIDQHALAERILYEQMRQAAIDHEFTPEMLLQPVTIQLSQASVVEDKIRELSQWGFDVHQLTDNSVVIYAIPSFLHQYTIDFDILFQQILYTQTSLTFDTIIEELFATKACKAAIKANQKLSSVEMKQLITDGFREIDQFFVCQHGRPFFIKLTRSGVEKLFDR